ncbi:MAG TPA: type I methionyl aminopeptidase [Patescibacteria group bacterium]|nr:type I methionyl aminopeptidase [Patescibacteria group bacterium]
MMTQVKTAAEIEAMRESGHLLATVLQKLRQEIAVGMSTKDLAEIAKEELRALGGQPTFLGFFGYPDVLCVSINDEVVHGIPRPKHFIQAGDLVSMDFGVTYRGMVTDAAISVIVGTAPTEVQDLLKRTEASLQAGIKAAHGGCKIGDIGAAVQAALEPYGYGIVRDLVGHGVGHQLHEDPNIPNYGSAGTGETLQTGMTVAIEPMATLGGYKVQTDADQWTIRTLDGSVAAHFEHTILLTDAGSEILTQL